MRKFKKLNWLRRHISKSNNGKTFDAEGMKFVPQGLNIGEQVFYWREDTSKLQQGRESGKWLKVEIIAVKSVVVVTSIDTSIFHVNASKLRRPLNTVDLEELLDSCERTRALVLWPSCDGQTDVWELFSDNSYLSVILDRQGLENKESWELLTTGTTRLLVKDENKESQGRCDVSDGVNQVHKAKGSFLVTVCARPQQNIKILGVNISLFCDLSKQNLVVEEGTRALLRGTQPKWIFHNVGDQHANAASSLTIWVPSSGRVNSGNQRTWTNLFVKCEKFNVAELSLVKEFFGKHLCSCHHDGRGWQSTNRCNTMILELRLSRTPLEQK